MTVANFFYGCCTWLLSVWMMLVRWNRTKTGAGRLETEDRMLCCSDDWSISTWNSLQCFHCHCFLDLIMLSLSKHHINMQYYIWYRSPSSRREYNSYSTSAHWTMGKPGYRRTLPHSTPTGANEGCLATMAYCFTSILWGESCVAWWMAEIALDFLKVFGEDRSCPSWAHCSEVSIYIGCKIYQAHSAVSNFWVLKRWFLAKRGCSKKNGENVKNAGKKNSNCIYQPLFTRCKIQCQ